MEVWLSITVVVVVHETILVVLPLAARWSRISCHCYPGVASCAKRTHAIVVVTAMGTSGPAVISGQLSPSLHRLSMETFLVAPSEGELEIVLVGVGVAITTECTAAAWHDDANTASMVSVVRSRISSAWLGYTGRWDRGGCEGNGNRSTGSLRLTGPKRV